METRAVVLRPATAGDAGFLAWGLNEAAGGLFDSLLGKRGPAILAAVIAQPVHAYSFEHAVVAEASGEPLGFCQGFPDGTPAGTGAMVAAARLRAVRAFSVAVLGWPVFAALERHQPGEWYLQAVAVRPQARGLGLGSTLLRDALTRAVAADCDTLTLDVDVANEGAIALYERLGLEVVSTSRRAVLLGDVRVHRMAVTVKSSDSHPGR
ncbi:MAG: hypothetical protein QG671_4454 [Actinomycetota bacterium]|nr:hypothetical protein [Actinomycetota bacterium]